jgi:pimeloyl-ACP methyl ester carboxylesterase
VEFFVGIGGYYDIEALITYVTTGFYREQESGPWLYRPPRVYAKWVFVLTNSGRVADPHDRRTLLEMASRSLDDAGADISDLVNTLGPQGRSVYALISNGDPDRVAELIADLPPEVRGEIEQLDLERRNLAALDTDFLLIHGRDDRMIPASQSVALARAVAPGRGKLYLVGGLDHAQVTTIGAGDALTLLQAIYECLRLRDQASGPD